MSLAWQALQRSALRTGWVVLAGLTLAVAGLVVGATDRLTLPALPDPLEQHLAERLQPSSPAHPLGTDQLGRDLLSRLVYGAGSTLGLAVLALALAALIGGILGLSAGLAGQGPLGGLLEGIFQLQVALPGHWVALFLLAVLGNSPAVLLLGLVVVLWPHFGWLARDEARSLQRREFVLAARALGADDSHLLRRHLAPHLLTPFRTLALIDFQLAVSLVATLSFLGLGVQAPAPSWGGMVAEGRQYFPEAWWVLTWPSVALAVVVLLAGTAGKPGRGVWQSD